MDSLKRDVGFTLIELLVSMGILAVLAALAISQYHRYRIRAYDAVARSDLKNAINSIENYFVEKDAYPATIAELQTAGFNFSKNVCFTRYRIENGGETVHMHIMHTSSPNNWHTRYPDDAGKVEYRDPAACL